MGSLAIPALSAQPDRQPDAAARSATPAPATASSPVGRRATAGLRPSQVPPFGAVVAAAQMSAVMADQDDPLETEARAIADRIAGNQAPPAGDHRADGLGAPPAPVGYTGPGEPIAASERDRMGQAIGHDFSQVRLHRDRQAAESARSVGAAAYTVGSHIVVGREFTHAAEPTRRWLTAHELAHVAQHADGRGAGMLHRQPEAVPELDRNLADAVERKAWQQAAQILNGFSPDDIERRVGHVTGWTGLVLTRSQAASVYVGALDNNQVGKDSAAAGHTRWAYLDVNYENELALGHWDKAAYFLNGFNENDIGIRLEKLHGDLTRLQALYDGAVASTGPASSAAVVSHRVITRVKTEAKVAAMEKSGELTLPSSTTAGGTPGQPAYITVGKRAAGATPAVADADRDPLSAGTDWSTDPLYIDNNIASAQYDMLANRFQLIYKDGTSIDLDYDGVKNYAGAALPPPPAPPPTPAPAAGVTVPSPPPPATPPPPVARSAPPPAEPKLTAAPLGERGLYFKAKSTGRIYPTLLNKSTIPTISTCALRIAQQEPEARDRLKEAIISVAVSARSVATATIAAGIKASLFSLGASRRSGAQFLLKNVDPAEVAASQQGYQVYEYFAEDGRCLYVGKSGGAGGTSPSTWVDRGWAHIADHPEIAEADHIRISAGLTEQEAFALEEVRIGAVRGTPGNLNVSPGEYTTRFGAAGLGANADAAAKQPTFRFETEIVPYSPAPRRR